MVDSEQYGNCALVVCKELIADLRKKCNNEMSYCEKKSVELSSRTERLLKLVRERLREVFDLLPPCKMHVHNYRDLAEGINRLRANKTLTCSAGLIVNCCLFVCIFVEEDFSRSKFYRLISEFDPENDDIIVNKFEK